MNIKERLNKIEEGRRKRVDLFERINSVLDDAVIKLKELKGGQK